MRTVLLKKGFYDFFVLYELKNEFQFVFFFSILLDSKGREDCSLRWCDIVGSWNEGHDVWPGTQDHVSHVLGSEVDEGWN